MFSTALSFREIIQSSEANVTEIVFWVCCYFEKFQPFPYISSTKMG
jgi:hypothetical protein